MKSKHSYVSECEMGVNFYQKDTGNVYNNWLHLPATKLNVGLVLISHIVIGELLRYLELTS